MRLLLGQALAADTAEPAWKQAPVQRMMLWVNRIGDRIGRFLPVLLRILCSKAIATRPQRIEGRMEFKASPKRA